MVNSFMVTINFLKNRLIDTILPPRCIVTGDLVDQQGMISPQAWAQLNFISDPQCYKCGYPFDFDSGGSKDGNICAGCHKNPPVFNYARSALVYDDTSRNIILGFKHGDQTQSVPSFLPWLLRAGEEILAQSDYFVPVPLHRWRILRRRYNQAGLIAQYLSKETGIDCFMDLIDRHKATVTQGHLKTNERQKNVRNAFGIAEKHGKKIRNKHICLIDDVLTTGATVNECTKILLKCGAASVNILTLARVVKPQKG
jgi:ComF family protein